MNKWKTIHGGTELYSGHPTKRINVGYMWPKKTPKDAEKIWRFMDLSKFLSIIQSKTLYFARADQFEDPFEGARGNSGDERKYVELLAEIIKEEIGGKSSLKSDEIALKTAEKMVQTAKSIGMTEFHMFQNFISCWHRNDEESDAMWRLYTKDLSQGIAVQTTCGRLWKSMKKEGLPGNIQIAYVQYIDYSVPLGFSDNPCWFKKNSFSHENEIRVIITSDNQDRDEAPMGVQVAVDPTVLVENLYISPMAQPWFIELVKDVVGKYGYEFQVVQSRLLDKGFR